jgi:hypothetical protein
LQQTENKQFDLLKQKIVTVMQQIYPGISTSISDWKGQEITDFQEELSRRVNAHISEKWFYTHIKGNHPTLPRVDMLNLLSRFAGYRNWDDFCFHNRTNPDNVERISQKEVGANKYFLVVPLIAIAVVAVFYGIFMIFNTREYQFEFVDADTREPITGKKISVTLLDDKESPLILMANDQGRLSYKNDESRIRMVVSAPYYRTDTIERIVKKFNQKETIFLHANDYALMIHYFSEVKVDDWKRRRERLEAMIGESAQISQIIGSSKNPGLILYTRDEFIDRMTMPVGSLQNMEILDTRFRDDKIISMRFRIKTDKR